MRNYQSDPYSKEGKLIPVVIVEFHDYSDLWLHKGWYEEHGKFKGLIKEMSLSIRDIKKVHHLLKYASSFPTQEWEG